MGNKTLRNRTEEPLIRGKKVSYMKREIPV